MKAVVITSFNQPPRYVVFADPVPSGADEMLIEVFAAGLHHIRSARVSAVHYSNVAFQLVSSVDSVGCGTNMLAGARLSARARGGRRA